MDILEPDGPRRAVVLVAHGLNVRAQAMRDLYEPLRAAGATIVSLSFRGHALSDRGTEAWASVSAEAWFGDWSEGVRAAQARAKDVPLTFLGFSLGCIVHLAALAASGTPSAFARQVLLAPPIHVRPTVRCVRLFRAFGRHFRLPSFTPKAIRAQNGTTVGAYEALFAVQQQLQSCQNTDALRVPTLLVLDPRDELVSYGRVLRWVMEHQLVPPWQVLAIREGQPAPSGLHHDMIDERSLGPRDYAALTARISAAIMEGTLT